MNDCCVVQYRSVHHAARYRHPGWAWAAILILAGGFDPAPSRAAIQIEKLSIVSDVFIRYNDFAGPEVVLSEDDQQVSVRPFKSFFDGTTLKDGSADAFQSRPGLVNGRQLYAAASQRSIANAVAAQTTYTGGADVLVLAGTGWSVRVRNTGTAPEPVDFSFFISGGGMDAWCASCFGGGLSLRTEAVIHEGDLLADPPRIIWASVTELDSRSTGTNFFNGEVAGSKDTLGIGYPLSALTAFPSAGDPYHRVTIEPFAASARLFMLDPGSEADISYTLLAKIEGSASALGAAWLVDPFSLGTTHGPLPNSQFAINGVSLSALLVPEPGQWMLMLLGLAAVARAARRRFSS